jgi:cation:H+ antiporter
MYLNFIYIISGLVLLAIGAESLVRGATGLALRLGVTALAIGLTIVAFGTSSPELAVGIGAARAGNGGLALGNVVGSNISNIALVLGFAALVKPMSVRSELTRREVPLMISANLLLLIMLSDGRLSRLEGIVLIVGAFAYTVFSYSATKRGENSVIAAKFNEALTGSKHSLWWDAVLLAAGLTALLIGASLLLKGARFVAAGVGVSQVVIGLTIVAIGTSLPELATSTTSALRGKPGIAFGNVIGSNVLNITAVLGAVALIQPFAVVGLRPLDLVVMVASAVFLLPLMWRGSVLNRWEAAILLVGYATYLYSLAP